MCKLGSQGDKRFTKSLIVKDNYSYIQYFDNDKPIYDKDIIEYLNELNEENMELKKNMNRAYNYFMDYLENEMSPNSFSEMWDFVIIDENWD